MPTYEYKCDDCEYAFEKILPMARSKEPQDCPECEGSTHRIFTSVNFVLKGDNWPGKAIRINRQMAKKNERLDRKQAERMRDDTSMPTLAPNVEGERVDSWSEAKKLAASKGKNTTSYDPYVRAEKEKS